MKKLENENLKNTDYRLITKELGINYKKLIRLVNTSIDIKTLIILTWYCSDLSDENGIYISKNKLNKLKNKENLDICDLIGLFKSGNKEILTNIIEFEKFYIMGIIKKEINKYNLIINKYQYKEIIEDITFELINILNNIVLRHPGQIVNYIRISLMYKALNYIIENIFNKSLTYIDEIGSKKNIKEFWDIDL